MITHQSKCCISNRIISFGLNALRRGNIEFLIYRVHCVAHTHAHAHTHTYAQ